MKSRIQKVALFGTSADPPSNGHQIIIKELSKIYDKVICYASNNPNKEHTENLYFRGLLLKQLITNFRNSKIIFDSEISSKWAISTIKQCKTKYNLQSIDFVIGSDLLEEIFIWKNIYKIIKEVNFLIIPREGYPINNDNLQLIDDIKGKYKLSSIKIPKISSSMIKENCKFLGLPKSLIPIVKENNLYKKLL